MARTPDEYTYSNETLARLSGWTINRIHQDVFREGVNLGRFDEACLWLASNATPEFRAELAKRLIPAVLGARRRTEENDTLLNQASSYDLMLEIFKRDRLLKDTRAKKIAKVRRRARA